jgi:hypothetical protein
MMDEMVGSLHVMMRVVCIHCEPLKTENAVVRTIMASGDGRSSLTKLFPQKKSQRPSKPSPDRAGSSFAGGSHGKRPYPSILTSGDAKKKKEEKDSDAFRSAIADFNPSASLGSSVSQRPALVSASGFDLHG